ncbi:dynamin family protein [Thiovibrio sp. JS02]
MAELEVLLRRRLRPLFELYGLDFENLLMPLKWKPIVLVIGNYSSGKSTFINELLGQTIQRTGQSPTDDSFTILAGVEPGEVLPEIPGSTVIRDPALPFAGLGKFGERLEAHLRLKHVDSPFLDRMVIIDTPGMLDSVTERDRGYDYLGVVGELARLADIIILMFDPFKAGTIKETYQAIRGTLPGSTSEDRILYVLNRIDECDSSADLVRSYGTLCWNLSQMTGRKDIPRIFLTYSPGLAENAAAFAVWDGERRDLIEAIREAPAKRVNHILQDVEREVRGLRLEVEALARFKSGFGARLKNILNYGMLAVLALFFFGDLLLKALTGVPETPLLVGLLSGRVSPESFLLPFSVAGLLFFLLYLVVKRFVLPRFVREACGQVDGLVLLDNAYKKDIWSRVRERVLRRLGAEPRRLLWRAHRRHLRRIERFLDKDLRRYYQHGEKSGRP